MQKIFVSNQPVAKIVLSFIIIIFTRPVNCLNKIIAHASALILLPRYRHFFLSNFNDASKSSMYE